LVATLGKSKRNAREEVGAWLAAQPLANKGFMGIDGRTAAPDGILDLKPEPFRLRTAGQKRSTLKR